MPGNWNRAGIGPKCVLCGSVEGQHRKGKRAEACTGFVSPDPEPTTASGEANNGHAPASRSSRAEGPPSHRDRERTPVRRSRLGPAEVKRARQALGFIVGGADNLAHYAAPQLWTDEDRLTVEESLGLVQATYDELEAVAPQALQWLAEISASSVHVTFAWAIAMVAVPRLERRGIVPKGTTLLITLAPLQMAARGAPGSDRPNGNGQVHVDSVVTRPVDVPHGDPNQVRQPDGAGL